MNEQETTASDSSNPNADQVTRLDYKQRVEHFAKGYDNAQSVVRFLDTKASAVIAAIPLLVGAVSGLFAIMKEWVRWDKAFAADYAWLLLFTFAAVIVFIIRFALKSLGAAKAAFDALTPQKPLDAKPSVIFPFEQTYQYEGHDRTFADRAKFMRSITADACDALDDWERQTIRMSEIVKRKINFVNDAICELKGAFVSAIWLVVVLAIMLISAAGLALTAPATTPPANAVVVHR